MTIQHSCPVNKLSFHANVGQRTGTEAGQRVKEIDQKDKWIAGK